MTREDKQEAITMFQWEGDMATSMMMIAMRVWLEAQHLASHFDIESSLHRGAEQFGEDLAETGHPIF